MGGKNDPCLWPKKLTFFEFPAKYLDISLIQDFYGDTEWVDEEKNQEIIRNGEMHSN